MKLYGCFILLILVLNTGALYRQEMEGILRNLDNRADFNKRLRWNEKDSRSSSGRFSESKDDISEENTEADDSSSSTVQDPVRVSVFNAGDYRVHIKVNYVINNQQTENELNTDIEKGQHRSIFIPDKSTSVRIRVKQIGIFNDKTIIDVQLAHLQNSKDVCYLLAHTRSNPVYGLCPSTYKAMSKAWGN